MVLVICKALKDIFEGVDFEGSEAFISEFFCLGGMLVEEREAWKVPYQHVAQLPRCYMGPAFTGLSLSHD